MLTRKETLCKFYAISKYNSLRSNKRPPLSQRKVYDSNECRGIYQALIAFLQYLTVNFLNIRTPKKFVVITLKFELSGSTIE